MGNKLPKHHRSWDEIWNRECQSEIKGKIRFPTLMGNRFSGDRKLKRFHGFASGSEIRPVDLLPESYGKRICSSSWPWSCVESMRDHGTTPTDTRRINVVCTKSGVYIADALKAFHREEGYSTAAVSSRIDIPCTVELKNLSRARRAAIPFLREFHNSCSIRLEIGYREIAEVFQQRITSRFRCKRTNFMITLSWTGFYSLFKDPCVVWQ